MITRICDHCGKDITRCRSVHDEYYFVLDALLIPNDSPRRDVGPQRHPPAGEFCSLDCLKAWHLDGNYILDSRRTRAII